MKLTANSASDCTVCPAGKKCTCAEGTAAANDDFGTCTLLIEECPQGKFCPEGHTDVNDIEEDCGAGYYCPAGTPYRIRCDPGYYCDDPNMY